MDHIQNIELQDMMAIIHGLRMSGLGFVEPDALDAINSRIKDLPSSEDLGKIYSDPREAQRITGEVGRIMELIDYYGTRNEESKTRYRAKTKLPPRYKNLKWKKAMSKFKLTKVAYELPDASNEVEAIVQRTKDVQSNLITTKQGVEQFVERLNTDIPEVMKFVPQQYQKSILQHQAIMNDAANQVGQTIQILMNDAESIGQAATNAGKISQQTEESVNMYSNMGNEMGNLATSKTYLKNIVKLSSNLEGNGIISQKLLTYAKNVKSNNPQAAYDAREITKLLSLSSLNREANVFIKTAGLGDMARGLKNMWNGGQQQVPAGYEQIDPGEQKGPQWQTGDEETQFKNDLNWLKRSWDNLSDFLGRYVRDANILVGEWSGKDDDAKVGKITELRDQAKTLFDSAEAIKNSKNFTSEMMGPEFAKAFGGTGEAENNEEISEEISEGVSIGQKYDYNNGTRKQVLEITKLDNNAVNYISDLGEIGSCSFSDFNKDLKAKALTLNTSKDIMSTPTPVNNTLLLPLISGDWENIDFSAISLALDNIDKERSAQENQLWNNRSASNKAFLKTSQVTTDKWMSLGIDPTLPSLNAFLTGNVAQLSQEDTDEIREILKKIQSRIKWESPTPEKSTPEVKEEAKAEESKTEELKNNIPESLKYSFMALQADTTGNSLIISQIDEILSYLGNYTNSKHSSFNLKLLKQSQIGSPKVNINSSIGKMLKLDRLTPQEVSQLTKYFNDLKTKKSQIYSPKLIQFFTSLKSDPEANSVSPSILAEAIEFFKEYYVMASGYNAKRQVLSNKFLPKYKLPEIDKITPEINKVLNNVKLSKEEGTKVYNWLSLLRRNKQGQTRNQEELARREKEKKKQEKELQQKQPDVSPESNPPTNPALQHWVK